MKSEIPLVDLRAQHASISQEIEAAIGAVLRESAFVGGPYLAAFEREFAEFCGAAYCVGVSNGTDALALGLRAAGIGPGDEVVTVPTTFIATTEAITAVGATIRLADVDRSTANLDPQAFEAALTERTRAVIPVHLYGQPADMDPILEIARRHDLRVIGDAAQAHGASYRDRGIATLGDATCFSFYPGKNLGAYGDAGGVVTDDAALATRISRLRNHGRTSQHLHEVEGTNARLDGLQAAVLSVKLKHLADWTRARRRLAEAYDAALADVPALALPARVPEARSVYHLYVVRARHRDRLLESLTQAGIAAGVHYPVPLHLQPAYAHLGHGKGAFPVAEAWAEQCLSLPLYPELTDSQLDRICNELRNAIERPA